MGFTLLQLIEIYPPQVLRKDSDTMVKKKFALLPRCTSRQRKRLALESVWVLESFGRISFHADTLNAYAVLLEYVRR